MIDDGTSETALGLAVHRDGRLYSSYPWFDLNKGEQLPQPPWRPATEQMFTRQENDVLDCLASDLVYRGLGDDNLLLEKRAFTCMSATPAAASLLRLPSEKTATLVFDRLRITIHPFPNGDGEYELDDTAMDTPRDRRGK